MNEINEIEFENGEGSEELYEQTTIVCDKGQQPLRIDKFLMGRIEGATRNKVQQAIEAGMVLVNQQQIKSNYKVKPFDEIIIYDDQNPETTEIIPQKMNIPIVYEDDDVIVVDKPAGMVVHPGCGNYTGTLANGIAYHLQQQNPEISENNLPRFGLVHRIDKNTSGLILLAKNNIAGIFLAKQFFDHTVERNYIALVWGDIQVDEGTITAHIGRHQRFRKIMDAYPEGEYGKPAVTHFKVLERFGYVTLVSCTLETGRTHQIRVHMKYLGHPLFNDETYGGDKILKGTVFSKYKMFVENCFAICPRHALHAQTLGFIHPSSKEKLLFKSMLPVDMEALIEKWRKYIAAKSKMPG